MSAVLEEAALFPITPACLVTIHAAIMGYLDQHKEAPMRGAAG